MTKAILLLYFFIFSSPAFAEELPDFSKGVSSYLSYDPNTGDLTMTYVFSSEEAVEDPIAHYTEVLKDGPSAEAYTQRGLAYAREQRWADAYADYESAIKLDPEYAEAYLARAQAYAGQGAGPLALADYNLAIQKDPDLLEAYKGRALIYLFSHEYDRSWADVHTLESKGHRVDRGFLEMLENKSGKMRKEKKGLSREEKKKRKKIDREIESLNKKIQKNPQEAVLFDKRGFAYEEKEFYDQALADYTKAIESDPQMAAAYYDRGRVLYQFKANIPQAISDMTRAIELDPKKASYYSGRAAVYVLQKDWEQALRDYDKSLELAPEHYYAYAGRCRVHLKLGHYDLAIQDATKALEIKPKNASLYETRAEAYYEKKEYDRSWRDTNKVIELGASLPFGFIEKLKKASGKDLQKAALRPGEEELERAKKLVDTSDFLNATSEATKAINLLEDKYDIAAAHNLRGIAYMFLRKPDLSTTDFQKSLELVPTYVDAYTNLGWMNVQMGNLDKAMEYANKALEIDPKFPQAFYNRGDIYFKKGQPREAIAEYSKAIEINPKYSHAFRNRASVYYSLGQFKECLADLEKAQALGLNMDPRFVEKVRQQVQP